MSNRCDWCGRKFVKPLKYEKIGLRAEWRPCCTRCANRTLRLGSFLAKVRAVAGAAKEETGR